MGFSQWRPLWRGMGALTLVLMAACSTLKEQGDAEFERGHFDDAMGHYEDAIAQGDRDPELFYRAGQASLKKGDFSAAERYFSRAIRHGGGVPVMRSLASLYIQTSNFSRAIDVLKELLRLGDDPYTVYQNLGVALIYTKQPVEAEDYLILAQHAGLDRPVAYFNLGLLYDRYLSRPALGLEFYRCYIALSNTPKDPQITRLSSRIEAAGEAVDQANTQVNCGQKYIASSASLPLHRLKAHVEKLAPLDQPPPPPQAHDDPPTVVIQPSPQELDQERRERSLAQAQLTAPLAFDAQKYALVIDIYQAFPPQLLQHQDLLLLAQSHQSLGRLPEAITYWNLAMERRPDALALSSLILLHQQSKSPQAQKVCQEAKVKTPSLFLAVEHLCKVDLPEGGTK